MSKNTLTYSETADKDLLISLENQAKAVIEELCEKAKLKKGSLVVVGCSSSEICGEKLGTDSNLAIAQAVFKGIYGVLKEREINLATQCCEHLNRAIIIEQEVAEKNNYEIVNVVPQPKAGGSFSTTAYKEFKNAVAVEEIKADAGIDIGGTLIGMHIKKVAVPIHLENRHIGEAIVLAARTRPKFVGGSRAVYDENLL
ncbi:MAG: TIGR01440 family protein [Clostridiales bacterium]|nr:TIGR01440 family protein [Clostridiales bacterium]